MRRVVKAKVLRTKKTVWIEDRGVRVPRRLVQVTPRIGVDDAGPLWAGKKWRFYFEPGKNQRDRLPNW